MADQGIVLGHAGNTLDTQAIGSPKIHKQHAYLVLPGDIARRIEHAIAVIEREDYGLCAKHAYETGITAFV